MCFGCYSKHPLYPVFTCFMDYVYNDYFQKVGLCLSLAQSQMIGVAMRNCAMRWFTETKICGCSLPQFPPGRPEEPIPTRSAPYLCLFFLFLSYTLSFTPLSLSTGWLRYHSLSKNNPRYTLWTYWRSLLHYPDDSFLHNSNPARSYIWEIFYLHLTAEGHYALL